MVATQKKEKTADRELIIERLIDAPNEVVFKVWTDPKHVAVWWGPDGFTNTIHEMDVKPGGVCRFIMHGPDGTDYPNKIVFIEVEKPDRLVYMHGSDIDNDPDQFEVTITFEAQESKTLVRMRSLFNSAQSLEAVKKFGAVEGGNQTLSRLEEYLKTSDNEL